MYGQHTGQWHHEIILLSDVITISVQPQSVKFTQRWNRLLMVLNVHYH